MTEPKRKTILVVEDETDILYSLEIFLESCGYRVLTAENGQAALERIEEAGRPDLILLDMKMPVMSGWQFAEKYHSAPGTHAPILVMTAAADAETRAKDSGALAWIGKPFALQELLELVRKYC